MILGVSDLFHCVAARADREPQIPRHSSLEFLEQKTKMTLGTWRDAARDVAELLGREPSRFVAELPELVGSKSQFMRIVSRVVNVRNKCVHPEGAISIGEGECIQRVAELRPEVEQALLLVRFLREYPLGFATLSLGVPTPGNYRFDCHSCMGARIADTEQSYCAEFPVPLQEGFPFIVAKDGARLLYPWPMLLERVAILTGRRTLFAFETIASGEGEFPRYSMELALGDLNSRIDQRRQQEKDVIPWEEPATRDAVVREFRSIALAVAHLHDMDIVHRDLKPGNVRLLEDGSLRLSDFGLVKKLRPSEQTRAVAPKSSTGGIKGTRDYMAPEQERGEAVGKSADVYSLAVMLAELATGHWPEPKSTARSGSTLQQAEPLSRLPGPLRDLLTQCTDVVPQERPHDARALLEKFDACLANLGIAAER